MFIFNMKMGHLQGISSKNLISLLSYGDDKFGDTKYQRILVWTVRFIKDSERFDEQLKTKMTALSSDNSKSAAT